MKIKELHPSSAHRWFACSGSVYAASVAPLIETEEEKNIALEGTAAHKLMETATKARKNAYEWVGKTLKLDKPPALWQVSEDMADHIQAGVELVLERSGKGRLWLEQFVPIIVNGMQCGGTLDAGWYGQYKNEDGKHEWQLHLLDLKYGYLAVDEPGKNKQLHIYASALVREIMSRGKPLDNVHLWIFQPRAENDDGPFKHDIVSVDDIHAFELDLFEAVKRVTPMAPRTPGPHCLHCGALATCKTAEQRALRSVRRNYTDEDRQRIGDLLFLRPEVLAWAKAVFALGTSMGLHNKPPVGWVMGNGRRSKRWQGEKADWPTKIGPKLKAIGFKEDEYAPRKLASPAKLVGLAGKGTKQAEKLEKLWYWTQGAKKLQPEANARNRISMKDFFEEHDYGNDDDDE